MYNGFFTALILSISILVTWLSSASSKCDHCKFCASVCCQLIGTARLHKTKSYSLQTSLLEQFPVNISYFVILRRHFDHVTYLKSITTWPVITVVFLVRRSMHGGGGGYSDAQVLSVRGDRLPRQQDEAKGAAWVTQSYMSNCNIIITVMSAYKEPAYKELLVIRNWFSFPNPKQETSSLYVNKEHWL